MKWKLLVVHVGLDHATILALGSAKFQREGNKTKRYSRCIALLVRRTDAIQAAVWRH